MTFPVLNLRARGIVGAYADAGAANTVLAELRTTVEAFMAEHKKELEGIDKRFADVVQTEKVDRINAEITALQKTLDDINATVQAMRVGSGGGDTPSPEAAEYNTAFNRWFRRGVEPENFHELAVKAALTTDSNPDGGFVVPEQMSSTIDRVLGTVSVMRSVSSAMTISAPVYKKLVNKGGADAGWVGEKEARPETATPTLVELVFNTHELYANPAATQTMLDDGAVDIAAWIADEVAITFAEQEGAAFVTGDGVKKPRGILAYDTVENGSYAWGKIGYKATGAAAGFATTAPADALISLYYALKSGYRNGATWITSDALMETIRKMKDGQGNYLWAAPTLPDTPATILGKPVVTDDNMPGLGANAFPIAFGNFKRGYLIIDRFGTRVLRDPFTNKPYVHFYTTKRVGGGIANFEAIKLMKCEA